MTAELAIEVKEVVPGEYHLYLVYQAQESQPWQALHGFPEHNPLEVPLEGWGNIRAFLNTDIESSPDARGTEV